ncbi:MAG: response regulator [Treponemataceae bacterium]
MAHILIVDDSFTARGILKRLLGDAYTLNEADEGAAALKNIAEERFDLVLLDLLMPGMDGFATLEAIKALSPTLPVLVVTADIQDSTRARIMKAGAAGIVNKPVKKDDLLAAIHSAIESK